MKYLKEEARFFKLRWERWIVKKSQRISGRQEGKQWSSVKVNWCFHSRRHRSKPFLTHAEDIDRTVWEAYLFQVSIKDCSLLEKKNILLCQVINFLCLLKRPWCFKTNSLRNSFTTYRLVSRLLGFRSQTSAKHLL